MNVDVLVVEDDATTRRALIALLVTAGYEVIAAEDGVDALEQFRSHRPHVVVSDWMMPRMDGMELCRAIRAEDGAAFAYFLLLTGAGERDQVVEVLDAGADEYLLKPVRPEELLARIRVALRIAALERERARHRAAEAERHQLRKAVAAMEQVLGVVGHELRTPLAGVRAMSEFLVSEESAALGEREVFLRNINDEVVRLAETVDQLLEAARLNSGRARWTWSEFLLRPVCDTALEGARRIVDHGQVELTYDVRPANAAMWGDSDAVRRFIMNLANNSAKHTKQGRIHVQVDRDCDDRGAYVRVVVSDTGAGIPPAALSNLGEAFALNSGIVGAASAAGAGGTGLGIAIARRIAAAHGGSISVESRVEAGTTVTAYLRADLGEPADAGEKIDMIIATGIATEAVA